MASAAYDSEGVQTVERDLVKDGLVEGYLLDSYAARKMQMQTTGNSGGVFNLLVKPNGGSFDDLIKELGTGMIVTEVMGQGVNLVNGDYSRGASGFWVQNGKIQHSVEEVTVAGNLRNMFGSIKAFGSDIETRGGIRCGSILIGEMTVTG